MAYFDNYYLNNFLFFRSKFYIMVLDDFGDPWGIVFFVAAKFFENT
jgi:hypothetical protein